MTRHESRDNARMISGSGEPVSAPLSSSAVAAWVSGMRFAESITRKEAAAKLCTLSQAASLAEFNHLCGLFLPDTLLEDSPALETDRRCRRLRLRRILGQLSCDRGKDS